MSTSRPTPPSVEAITAMEERITAVMENCFRAQREALETQMTATLGPVKALENKLDAVQASITIVLQAHLPLFVEKVAEALCLTPTQLLTLRDLTSTDMEVARVLPHLSAVSQDQHPLPSPPVPSQPHPVPPMVPPQTKTPQPTGRGVGNGCDQGSTLDSISVFQLNINGARTKRATLDATVRSKGHYIIILQESLLQAGVRFSLSGLTMYSVPAMDEGARSLLTFVHSSLPSRLVRNPIHCRDGVEMLAVTVTLLELTAYNLYRPGAATFHLGELAAAAS